MIKDKSIDDYVKDGFKVCAMLDYCSNETGNKFRHIVIYSKGSLMLFYDKEAQKIIYKDADYTPEQRRKWYQRIK